MEQPKVGSLIEVIVTKVTLGKDNKLYITISSPHTSNQPTFIWRQT